jgi:hypothetical protein
VSQWPFPGDLPVDRARQVALEYRRALWERDPDACAKIDSVATAVGENWVISDWAVETGEDLVTIPRAAELVGRSTRWVYNLAQQRPDLVQSRSPIMMRLRDVQAASAAQRARRARHHGAMPNAS